MFQRLVLSLLFLLLTFVPLFFPSSALAQTKDWNNGRCVNAGIDAEVATIQGFECLFFNVLQIITVIAGLVFLIMFIVGGFQYLMSSNDQKAVAQASNTLTMSIIALVGVILAWVILRFITNFTGVSVTDFIIPGP